MQCSGTRLATKISYQVGASLTPDMHISTNMMQHDGERIAPRALFYTTCREHAV